MSVIPAAYKLQNTVKDGDCMDSNPVPPRSRQRKNNVSGAIRIGHRPLTDLSAAG